MESNYTHLLKAYFLASDFLLNNRLYFKPDAYPKIGSRNKLSVKRYQFMNK
jgi:hypothetical protein